MSNTAKASHTEANRKLRMTRDSRFKANIIHRSKSVHRGDARRLRRNAWMSVAAKVKKPVVVPQFDSNSNSPTFGQFINKVEQRDVWIPSFADWSKKEREQGRG